MSAAAQDPSAAAQASGKAGAFVLAAVVVAAAAVRLATLRIPLERDEGEYAWGGFLLLRGEPPFRSYFTLKLPGTAASYAASMALFGESIAGIRLGLLLVNLFTTVLVFLLGRRLIGRRGAVAAATAFCALSLSPALLGTFAHATHYVLFPALAGLLVLHHALEDDRRPWLFALGGALLGAAVLMKQAGAVFPLFAFCWLLAAGRRRPDRLRELGAFCLGAAAPLALTAAALLLSGTLGTAFFWTFTYARTYASATGLGEGAINLRGRLVQLLPQTAGLLLFFLGGLALAARDLRRRRFLLAFLAFSLLGVCPGLYFRSHYFILALPAVCLLAGAALDRLCEAAGPAGRGARAGVLALFALAVLQPFALAGALLRSSPEQISRTLYGRNPFPEALVVGNYLRAHATKDQSIAVLGSEPEIYFYSQRRSATRHLYMYNLVEAQPFAAQMQEQLIGEVEAARPAWVVYVRTHASWVPQPSSSSRIFQWAGDYLRRDYQKVGQVEAPDPTHTRYLWGSEAAAAPRDDFTQLQVFRRRDDAR